MVWKSGFRINTDVDTFVQPSTRPTVTVGMLLVSPRHLSAKYAACTTSPEMAWHPVDPVQVRLVYMSAILDSREELDSQQKKHQVELAALKQQLEAAQKLIAEYTSGAAQALGSTERNTDCAQAAKSTPPEMQQVLNLTSQHEDQPEEVWWPVCSHELPHIPRDAG